MLLCMKQQKHVTVCTVQQLKILQTTFVQPEKTATNLLQMCCICYIYFQQICRPCIRDSNSLIK